MALKIVTGGSTGAADGTLVSSGNPLVIVALNTAVDAHIRCDDGYWSNDQDFDVPAQLEVSFDGGSTWYGNGDEPITAPEIYAVNVPIKVRQTTAAGSTSGSFVTDGTYTAIAALSTPTLTATTASGTQVDLSWTNVSNEDASPGYTIEYSSDGVSYSALTTKAADVTTHSHTGLTTGRHYYRVKAEGSGRYSDSGWGTDDDVITAVSSFFSAAGDGMVRNLTSSGSWSTDRSAGSGTDVYATNAAVTLVYNEANGSGWYIGRGYLPFDTSSLPDGATIVSARIRVYPTSGQVYTGETAHLCTVESTQASTSTLATSDFSQVGSTELADRKQFSTFTADTYNDITLNSSGLAHISKTGYTKFAFRGSKDLDNSAPTAASGVGISYSEQTGTSKDPILEVTYY